MVVKVEGGKFYVVSWRLENCDFEQFNVLEEIHYHLTFMMLQPINNFLFGICITCKQ